MIPINSQAHLAIALQAAQMIAWTIDLKTGEVAWSEAPEQIFGFDPHSFGNTLATLINYVHPDDQTRALQTLETAIHQKTPYELECQLLHPSGQVIWVYNRGEVKYDQQNNPAYMVGISQNINPRKQTEVTLYESQQQYRALTEAMPQIVWTADSTGAVNYFNQRWYDYSGLSVAQSMGLEGANSIHPDEREQILITWQQAITEQTLFEIEYRVRRWDGMYRWFICRSIPIKDESQNLQGWIGTITDIDELKRAQQAVIQSEKQLRRVLNSLFSFVGVMTPDGILIEANETALKAASLRAEQVLGKPFAEAYWWSYSPTIQAQLQAAIQQAAQGEIIRYDVQVRLGENQFIIIDFAIVPLLDSRGQVEYLIPSGIDITERKQMEIDLRENQAQLQQQLAEIEAIYQSAPIGLSVIDPNLRFIRINQRLADINGASVEAHLGRTVREVLPGLADTAESVLANAFATGEPLLNVEISGETPAQPGVQRFWLEHFLPLKDGDQVVGISIVCQEITEQKRIEQEQKQVEEAIRKSESQLRQQTEQLAQANRIKDEFLAVLSHELRTPLNPILGWSKLLQTRTFSSEKTQQALATIERNAKLQVQLIEDLLDISRIIRGKLSLNLGTVSLIHPITAAIETVYQAAEAKSITIATELDPSIRDISGDAGRLQQVIWNLLSNAIKFTPVGGEIKVSLRQIGDEAEIQVQDTGKGIDPVFIPYLFEMFRQQDSSITRQFGGLGLGLAISRQLVEAHGGSINASSTGEGKGATFMVRLPINPSVTECSLPITPADESSSLQGVQVLVVDDEADTLELLQVVLRQEGANVRAVNSAQTALEELVQTRFDVLVSDLQMPQIDGYTFMRQVRSLPELQNLPAIALSAYAYETNREASFQAGYQQHLAKPIEPMVLVKAIAQLIR